MNGSGKKRVLAMEDDVDLIVEVLARYREEADAD
jgi:hypothetical protein